MKRTILNVAASTLVVGATMVACAAQSDAMRRRSIVQKADSPADLQAADLHAEALRTLARGDLGLALRHMEEAVAQSPRDAGYRQLLAEIYMKAGRFESAQTTFADVLELDPSRERARLSLALMQIALGRPQAAVAQLDELEGRASPADLGLAFALAGMPERAIEILEPAARAFDASPRMRQNLALSLALAGDWRRARAIAAQDISPADVGPRMQQWAAFAHPDAQSLRIAGLLGIDPVGDPGQPVRLALAPAPAESFAALEPLSIQAPSLIPALAAAPAAPVAPVTDPAPIVERPVADWERIAAATPQPGAATDELAYVQTPVAPAVTTSAAIVPAAEAPAPRNESEARFAAAARTLNRPDPVLIRAASVSLPPAPIFRRDAPSPVRRAASGYVVQLGAYSNEANAERAWIAAEARYGLSDHDPLTTTISLDGRTLHRVSVAGFASQVDAARLCRSIEARGGDCFVRPSAGDASVRWAARHAGDRSEA